MIWRPLSLMLGLATLGAVWLGPLPAMADRLFVGHMLMHMLVVAVAAPLLAIGLAGGRLDFSARLPILFSPILASVIELFVVWAWHMPTLHHAAPWRGRRSACASRASQSTRCRSAQRASAHRWPGEYRPARRHGLPPWRTTPRSSGTKAGNAPPR